MINFDWSTAASALKDFGGEQIVLHISKTGLPFFDALRLYGAIDLYVGLREDVRIHDNGNEWFVSGQFRAKRMTGRDQSAFKSIRGNKKKLAAESYCQALRASLIAGSALEGDVFVQAETGLDAVLQSGIRGISAHTYETLQTGQTSKKECLAQIPLSHCLLAFVGKRRTEQSGNIIFLPIFEGGVDLSRVVSPLRGIGLPNVLCAQALILLALKTSLFAEGYQERLTAVTFSTNLGRQRSDNYSGLITIASTAVGKMRSPDFVGHTYYVFRELVGKAWARQGRSYQSTSMTSDALAMGYWLMQPVGKHLSTMITSQERLQRQRYQQIFIKPEYVKEVFEMSYGRWSGNHEAVRKMAKAVASGIYHARMKERDDPNKEWYDEIVLLRSAPTAKAFIERAMILVEQGHRAHPLVGTAHREEAFEPSALFTSIGENRNDFETFRDLFRMYLVQESTYQGGRKTVAATDTEAEIESPETEKEDAE
ncbi:MAG: hypothetical protein M1136_11985 [Chloroflexi bacterium]|nr:hypothetical protein [Chloroflexota bacterium]